LKQAISENVKPILVLNKIDRLIIELKQTPQEAFIHLNNILEQVNAILGAVEAQDILEETGQFSLIVEAGLEATADADEDFYFSPEKGNVIFASAIDKWAFRTNQFARLYANKLGVKESILERFIWGKYFVDPKTKKIIGSKSLKGRNLKPLFVQFVLENIWAIYDAVLNTQ
jgi:ribosome assembly protein 1